MLSSIPETFAISSNDHRCVDALAGRQPRRHPGRFALNVSSPRLAVGIAVPNVVRCAWLREQPAHCTADCPPAHRGVRRVQRRVARGVCAVRDVAAGSIPDRAGAHGVIGAPVVAAINDRTSGSTTPSTSSTSRPFVRSRSTTSWCRVRWSRWFVAGWTADDDPVRGTTVADVPARRWRASGARRGDRVDGPSSGRRRSACCTTVIGVRRLQHRLSLLLPRERPTVHLHGPRSVSRPRAGCVGLRDDGVPASASSMHARSCWLSRTT